MVMRYWQIWHVTATQLIPGLSNPCFPSQFRPYCLSMESCDSRPQRSCSTVILTTSASVADTPCLCPGLLVLVDRDHVRRGGKATRRKKNPMSWAQGRHVSTPPGDIDVCDAPCLRNKSVGRCPGGEDWVWSMVFYNKVSRQADDGYPPKKEARRHLRVQAPLELETRQWRKNMAVVVCRRCGIP
jgi:hypothetical protein